MGLLCFRGAIKPSSKAESSTKAHPHFPRGGMLFLRSSRTDGNKATWPVGLRFSLFCWGPFSYQFRQPGISPPLCTPERGAGRGTQHSEERRGLQAALGERWRAQMVSFPPEGRGVPAAMLVRG